MQTSKESSGVDKQGLWGWWHYNQRWRENLNRKAAHKALDIPEDDGMINSPRTTNVGMGWKELAVIAAMVLGGGYGIFQLGKDKPAPPPAQQNAPVDSEYEVRFYDSEGKLISLPHISERPQQ